MVIDYRLLWEESSGRLQYGLNTPDGVNMVVFMVQDSWSGIDIIVPWLWMGKMHLTQSRGRQSWINFMHFP